MKRKGIRLNTVVLVSIIGTVVLVLLTAMVLFYRTYRSALLRNAETAGLRTVAQVSSTVNNYLSNIDSVMDSLSGSFEGTDSNQEEFFDVFLRIRPDVIAVSTYGRDGVLLDCFSQGHTLFQPIENNLSMDSARIRQEIVQHRLEMLEAHVRQNVYKTDHQRHQRHHCHQNMERGIARVHGHLVVRIDLDGLQDQVCFFLLHTFYPSSQRQAASAATAPSAAAVVSWRTAFARQSPAAKTPALFVRQSSPASA